MTEVFITNIKSKTQADDIVTKLKIDFPELKIHIDWDDTSSSLSFPCGHTILRVEGATIDPGQIISVVTGTGILCDILEDKICQ